MPFPDEQYFRASPYFAQLDQESGQFRVSYFEQLDTTLPKPLRTFLLAPETAEQIVQVATSFGLHENQMGALARIVRQIVTGHLFIKDLPAALIKNLVLEKEGATAITAEIIKTLFASVLDDIKRVQQERFADRLHELAQQKNKNTAAPPLRQGTNPHNIIDLRKDKNSP